MQKVCGEKLTMYWSKRSRKTRTKVKIARGERERKSWVY